jgi:hypothetical protein
MGALEMVVLISITLTAKSRCDSYEKKGTDARPWYSSTKVVVPNIAWEAKKRQKYLPL